MPYPVDIPPPTSKGFSIGLNGTRGRYTFQHGSDFYAFLCQDDTSVAGTLKVQAMKSTNLGLTWAAMDSSNAPAVDTHTGIADSYTVSVDSDTAWVLSVRLSVATPIGIKVTAFDLSTDLWAVPSNYSSPVPDFINNGTSQTVLSLCVVGANDYQLMYSGPRENVSGVDCGRVYIAAFDGTTFGTSVELPDQAGNLISYGGMSCIAENSRCHFFYISTESGTIGAPLYHVGLDTDGTTFGTTAKVTDDLYWGFSHSSTLVGQTSEAIIANIAAADRLAIAAEINDNSGSTSQSLRVFYSALGLNPTWSNTIASQGVDGGPELPRPDNALVIPAFMTLGYANGNLILIWTWQANSFTTPGDFNYTKSLSGSFSWSAYATLFQPSIADNTPTQMTSFDGTAGVGIVGLSLNTSADSEFLAQFYFVPFGRTVGNFWSVPNAMLCGHGGNCWT